MTVTIAGAKEGFNGLLSVTGYGSLTVRVEKIRYAVEIYSEQASSAHGKVFYPGWLQDADFSLELVHVSLADRDAFNRWMRGYMTKVTTGGVSQGSVLVRVPGRRFVRRAIPMGTLNLGDSIAQSGKAYRTALVFRGATDPIAIKAASAFRAAKTDPATSAPFYPSTGQKKGAESLDGTIFDEGGEQSVDRILGSLGGSTRTGLGPGGS